MHQEVVDDRDGSQVGGLVVGRNHVVHCVVQSAVLSVRLDRLLPRWQECQRVLEFHDRFIWWSDDIDVSVWSDIEALNLRQLQDIVRV